MKRTIGPLKIIILLSCLLLLCSMISCGSGTIGIEENDTRVEEQDNPYKNDLYGYINSEGEMVIEPKYDLAWDFSEGLAPVEVCEKWGYIDNAGNMVIEPQFYGAGSFSEGLATASSSEGENLGGYIDKTGQFVIEPHYTDLGPFSEGFAAVSEDGDYFGYIDKSGEYIAEPQWWHAFNFSEGLARVWLGRDSEAPQGFIDKTGEYAFPPELEGIETDGSFYDGRAIVYRSIDQYEKLLFKYGFIDIAGNVVIEPQFDEVDHFSEGLAPVKVGDKWGYIDIHGNIVVEPQFDFACLFSDGLGLVGTYNGDESEFGERGYIDRMGNFVFHSENGLVFHEGLAQFTNEEGKTGYMDKNGAVVVEPQFAEAGDFSEGLAWVKY